MTNNMPSCSQIRPLYIFNNSNFLVTENNYSRHEAMPQCSVCCDTKTGCSLSHSRKSHGSEGLLTDSTRPGQVVTAIQTSKAHYHSNWRQEKQGKGYRPSDTQERGHVLCHEVCNPECVTQSYNKNNNKKPTCMNFNLTASTLTSTVSSASHKSNLCHQVFHKENPAFI